MYCTRESPPGKDAGSQTGGLRLSIESDPAFRHNVSTERCMRAFMAHFPLSFCPAGWQQDWHWSVFLLIWPLLALPTACEPFPGTQLTRTNAFMSLYSSLLHTHVAKRSLEIMQPLIPRSISASSANKLFSSSTASHVLPPRNRSKMLSLLTRCSACWGARIPPQLTQVPVRAAAAVFWA